ncbi:hypothetical protein B0A50_05065 [Salinomyces thailandicus]|uniref:Glutathione S-transferase kappa n=1 Tax=Salinomyces thailandicus TaxID=706561 RepID=A0A4U0TWA3_9PEZI|nr:hypothetical protein B0A50_05065 [Salinomyces thailandica]
MPRPKLTLYLDIVSPFAYMAFHVTQNSPIFKQCDITYIPIFLGGLMKTCNNRPPIEIKNKDKWIETERHRWSTRFNIPMAPKTPSPFPQPTLACQRTLCAIAISHPAKLIPSFTALYTAFWAENTSPIGKPEVFQPLLAKVLGEEVAAEMVKKGGEAEAKGLLSKNTEDAFQAGAFGLPYFVAEDGEGRKEGFWGFDHLAAVIEALGLERGEGGVGFRAML